MSNDPPPPKPAKPTHKPAIPTCVCCADEVANKIINISNISSDSRVEIGLDESVGIKLGCDDSIHYNCLVMYIRSKLDDRISLIRSIETKDKAGIVCPYGPVCKQINRKITINELDEIVNLGKFILLKDQLSDFKKLEKNEIDTLKSWINEDFGQTLASKNEVQNNNNNNNNNNETNLMLLATTKPCPACGFRSSHIHQHHCHHISPNGGCPNNRCRVNYCYKCLKTGAENRRERGRENLCLCGGWSNFCKSLRTEDDISKFLVLKPYPHDLRCGCIICSDCSFGKPCSQCSGHCDGFISPGPTSLTDEVITSFRTSSVKGIISCLSELVHAVLENNIGTLRRILSDPSNLKYVNQKDNVGKTILLYAVETQSRECVDYLLSINTINVNIRDSQLGKSPLIFSCEIGNLDITEQLLQHNANSNIADNDGMLPIMYAARSGHIEIVLLLVSKVNQSLDNLVDKQKNTIFHFIASNGNVALFELFYQQELRIHEDRYSIINNDNIVNKMFNYRLLPKIQFQIDFTRLDNRGRSILHRAITANNHEVVSHIIEKQNGIPNLNSRFSSPLHLAFYHGCIETATFLLLLDSRNVSLSAKDSRNKSPFDVLFSRIIQNTTPNYSLVSDKCNNGSANFRYNTGPSLNIIDHFFQSFTRGLGLGEPCTICKIPIRTKHTCKNCLVTVCDDCFVKVRYPWFGNGAIQTCCTYCYDYIQDYSSIPNYIDVYLNLLRITYEIRQTEAIREMNRVISNREGGLIEFLLQYDNAPVNKTQPRIQYNKFIEFLIQHDFSITNHHIILILNNYNNEIFSVLRAKINNDYHLFHEKLLPIKIPTENKNNLEFEVSIVHYCCYYGLLSWVKYFVENCGININTEYRDNQYYSPLQLACISNERKVIKYLLHRSKVRVRPEDIVTCSSLYTRAYLKMVFYGRYYCCIGNN